MLYRKIITCLSLSLAICCLTSGNARAVPCSNPNCDSLGYRYTADQCGEKASLKCPFDNSKFFCNAQISIPKTCKESLLEAGLAPVSTSQEYINAFLEKKEIVLLDSVYMDDEVYDPDTGELGIVEGMAANNNVYIPSALSTQFPSCKSENNFVTLGSTYGTFYIESVKDDEIVIYPYFDDGSYGTEIDASVTFKNGASFDSLLVSNGKHITFENGNYNVNYSSDFSGSEIAVKNNSSITFYGGFTNLNSLRLSNNSCVDDGLYKICAAEAAVITPRNGSQLVIPDDTANYSGEFTTNCMEGTTAQYLDQPKTCEGYNKKPVYGWPGQNITSWCPVTYSTSSYITCQSGYQVSQSKEYPGCYICREVVSDAKKQQCADEKTACYKSADTKRDKCVQKANIDRENCAYRASEAYDNCISMGGWWYDCDQTKQQAWDDCDYTYTYDDLDWCTSTHATDYDDCDTSYDNCLEGKELSVVDDAIVCMKCP